MLFPGIYKMGKQLGLFSSGSTIFGQYRGFSICAFDGNNKKEFLIKVQQSLNEQDLVSLKKKYKFKNVSYETVGYFLKFEFSEILKPYSYKKIISLTDEVIDICKASGILPINKCNNCDNSKVSYYQYNGNPLTLCSSCYSVESFKVDNAQITYSNIDNNYLQGLLGAILFSIPGIIIQALLFIFLSRLGAVSSVIYCYLALLGFTKFKGKTTPLSAGFIIFVSLSMTIIGTVFSYSGLLLYKTQDLQRVVDLLSMIEVQNELRGNIVLQAVLSSIYLIIEFFSIKRNWTFKTLQPAKSLS